jgi:hypothetical protein
VYQRQAINGESLSKRKSKNENGVSKNINNVA